MTDHRDVVGLEYLDAVTRVLHRRRLAEPARETWEAAELQWWWPRDQHEDPSYARVWCDADGPSCAVIFTRWGHELGCTVLADGDFAPAWRFIAERSAALQPSPIELEIIDREVQMRDAARASGYVPSENTYVASWMQPSEIRAPRRPLADGYEIVSRAQTGNGPHPMAGRNGTEVEPRLRECSLYDPNLDLAVRAADGTIAGYALFWADPLTRVGVVEPMRIEDAHAGRGLATQLLSAGLRRLTEHGCTRLKVIAESSNPVALALYAGAGFRVTDVSRVWRYRGAPGPATRSISPTRAS
jgi:ribosomal protein S18 acetylase RimI-like enzyme